MLKFSHLFSRFFKDKEDEPELLKQIDRTKLPQHVAIIMDGNGRWAQSKGLPRSAGHRAGVETLRNIIEACVELEIKVLTVYAFSTENWKRPEAEVRILMNLIVEYLRKELDEMHRQNISIRPIGNLGPLPEEAKKELFRARETTRNNTGLIFNVALNYGGRKEIVEAAKAIGAKIEAKKMRADDITEDIFAGHLFTAGQPDPDLLIRPSGELRISNYLLWQLAYAEFYYTGVYWPDFNKAELLKAIADFQKRSRRYGGLA
ncbi:MAG: isoprenyl transferase [Desulfitobacteriaceae bacterium]|nr:isoprenyl transferase [Desulfitobacteriaceae bacterium]